MGCCIGAIDLPRWETARNENIQVLTLLGLSLQHWHPTGFFCTCVEAFGKTCRLFHHQIQALNTMLFFEMCARTQAQP